MERKHESRNCGWTQDSRNLLQAKELADVLVVSYVFIKIKKMETDFKYSGRVLAVHRPARERGQPHRLVDAQGGRRLPGDGSRSRGSLGGDVGAIHVGHEREDRGAAAAGVAVPQAASVLGRSLLDLARVDGA